MQLRWRPLSTDEDKRRDGEHVVDPVGQLAIGNEDSSLRILQCSLTG